MTVSKTVEPCPYVYFPDRPDIKVERMQVFDNDNGNALVAYCDFYIDREADTTYFLMIYATKPYRGRWTEMVVCPEISNYFGTANEVSVGISPDIQADVIALINNKLKNPDINETRHILSGVVNDVVEPGQGVEI